MENNYIGEILPAHEVKDNQQKKKTMEERTCNCCGRKLPISEFKAYRGGKYARVCNTCAIKNSGASEKFAQFTTRELLDELKVRGWRGQLRCTRIETISI